MHQTSASAPGPIAVKSRMPQASGFAQPGQSAPQPATLPKTYV